MEVKSSSEFLQKTVLSRVLDGQTLRLRQIQGILHFLYLLTLILITHQSGLDVAHHGFRDAGIGDAVEPLIQERNFIID